MTQQIPLGQRPSMGATGGVFHFKEFEEELMEWKKKTFADA